MADTILNGDIQVNYSDDNRWKSLNWLGSATQTYTLNEVYSALQDLFDEAVQMDDGTVMSAETPTEYTIGIIDSGDSDPWYVTYELMEHITGGALRTSSWARVEGSNTGIVVVPVTSNTFASGDIGNTVETSVDLDKGTLLEIIEAGTTDYLVIRPQTSAAGNSFDDSPTSGGTIQIEGGGGNSATQAGASVTSEQIWANVYTIGTIEEDTHIYLYQGAVSDATRSRITSIADLAANPADDWWSEGHIDVCVYTKDFTQDGPTNIVDGGYIKAFARKGSTNYDSFETATSTTSGGRNPVPINTSADLDNPTGYKSITLASGTTDDFSVGDEIEGGSSGARAIITQIDGTWDTYTFHYYLIGDPQTDFQTAGETITNNDATGSATKDGNAPTDQGPADSGWFTGTGSPTISFGNTTYDVDDDGTDEWYGITVDCNQNPLSEVYEWLKYITRNGSTATALTYNISYTDGVEGEQYVGAEAYLRYTGTVTGTIAEGSDVEQTINAGGDKATGIVISHDTTNKVILLRDVRGAFTTNASFYTLTDNDTSGTVDIDSAATNFAPNKQAPFGSFPGGGTFFGARGVLLQDWATDDENSFSLIPVNGGTKQRPQAYSITVTNLVGTDQTTTTDDRVTVFRLTASGGSIDKTEFTAQGGEAVGGGTVEVTGLINKDVPGKTNGGVIRIRDVSDNYKNYRIRFGSWANTAGAGTRGIFTLANISLTGNISSIDSSSVTMTGDQIDTALRADLFYNATTGHIAYLTSVNATTNTATYAPTDPGSPAVGNTVDLNVLPIAPEASTDDIFVPLIDQYATSSSASVSIIYDTTIFYRARVRNVANSTPIKPFEVDSSLNGANSSVQTVRTTDTIYT